MAAFGQRTRMILLMVLSTGAAQSIITPPSDVTGKMAETARFMCQVGTFSPQGDILSWWFNGEEIYYYYDGQEGYPLGNFKYSVEQDGRTFELTVTDLRFGDGGYYVCDVYFRAEANLIVLGKPVLFSSPTNPVRLEGDTAELTCMAEFGGPNITIMKPDHFPRMQMFLNSDRLSGTVEEVRVENETVYYFFTLKHNLTLAASMNGNQLTCRIETLNPPQHEVVTTEVTVLYSVRNVSYTPQRKQLKVGTIINCTADGNPEPYFIWNDTLNSGNITYGWSLEITDAMVGNNSWRCTAWNNISGIWHKDSVDAVFEAVAEDAPSDTWKVAVGVTTSVVLAGGCVGAVYYGMTQMSASALGNAAGMTPTATPNVESAMQAVGKAANVQPEMPFDGMEMPIEGMEMPLEGTEVPLEGTEMPLEGTEMPLEGTEMPQGNSGHCDIDPKVPETHSINTKQVLLQVSSTAFAIPLTIVLKERYDSHKRRQQIEAMGLSGDLEPLAQLEMHPPGQKLSQPAAVKVKKGICDGFNKVWAFQKGQYLKDQWTDVTAKCALDIGKEEISFMTDELAPIELFRSSARFARMAPMFISAIMNNLNELCDFYVYYKPPESVLTLFIETQSNDNRCRHEEPSGYNRVGTGASNQSIIDKAKLKFYYDYSKDIAAENKHIAGEYKLNVEQCRKGWDRINLPVRAKSFKDLPKEISVCQTIFEEKELSAIGIGIQQDNDSTSEDSSPTETRDEKMDRLAEYIKDDEGHRYNWIGDNFDKLVERMQTKSGFLSELVSKRVIDNIQLAEIEAQGPENRRNTELIQIITKVSDDKYLQFLETLASRQKNLVQLLTEGKWIIKTESAPEQFEASTERSELSHGHVFSRTDSKEVEEDSFA